LELAMSIAVALLTAAASMGGAPSHPSSPEATARAKNVLDELDAWGDDRRAPPSLFDELLGKIESDRSIPRDAKVDRLLRYAESHPRNRTDVLAMLMDWRTPKLGPWLLREGHGLTAENWGGILRVLIDQYVQLETWRDPRVVQAFVAETTNTNDDVRASAVGGVSLAGNAKQAVALLPQLLADSHSGIRYYIYVAQSRFDTPQGNAALRSLLRDYKEPSVASSIVSEDMVRNHRYDFLPDLRRLRARLRALTDVAQKDAATQMIAKIDSATGRLERDKKGGLPVGERLLDVVERR